MKACRPPDRNVFVGLDLNEFGEPPDLKVFGDAVRKLGDPDLYVFVDVARFLINTGRLGVPRSSLSNILPI